MAHAVAVVCDDDITLAGFEAIIAADARLELMSARIPYRSAGPCVAVLAPAVVDLRRLVERSSAWSRTGAAIVWVIQQMTGAVADTATTSGATVLSGHPPRAIVVAELTRIADRQHHPWSHPAATRSGFAPLPSGLTGREREVLRLYASGMKAVQVAHATGLSAESIPTYVRRIRQKYEAAGRPARTRVDLFRRAVEDGLVVNREILASRSTG